MDDLRPSNATQESAGYADNRARTQSASTGWRNAMADQPDNSIPAPRKIEMAMSRPEWAAGFARDICVSEQGPGFFMTRLIRGGPWVPVRVMLDQGAWAIFVSGEIQPGSGTADPWDCPFYRRGPFAPITKEQYHDLLREYEAAGRGHPLRQPTERVDLRSAPPLYEGRAR